MPATLRAYARPRPHPNEHSVAPPIYGPASPRACPGSAARPLVHTKYMAAAPPMEMMVPATAASPTRSFSTNTANGSSITGDSDMMVEATPR